MMDGVIIWDKEWNNTGSDFARVLLSGPAVWPTY